MKGRCILSVMEDMQCDRVSSCEDFSSGTPTICARNYSGIVNLWPVNYQFSQHAFDLAWVMHLTRQESILDKSTSPPPQLITVRLVQDSESIMASHQFPHSHCGKSHSVSARRPVMVGLINC
jgi:hypothetical protein